MTLTAIGAAASAPKPPPWTITPTAIGDGWPPVPGTKQVNTASLRLPLSRPFWAVPVFPSMTIPPAACWLAVANAVPPGFWVTWFIMACRLVATPGLIAWLSTWVLAESITDRPCPTTRCTRYGYMSLPPFATAAENIASWSGVTWSLYCPMAENAVSDLSFSGTGGITLGTTGSGIDRGLFMPNWLAYWRRVGAPSCIPRLPNAELQDIQNAWMIGGLPSPQISPPSLTSVCPFGSWSGDGAWTSEFVFFTRPVEKAAELVTTLNEEPGGNVAEMARFSSGWDLSVSSCWSTWLSFVPSSVAR